jgi:hypothetical protein
MFSLKTKKVISNCGNVYEMYNKCIKSTESHGKCDYRKLEFYNCLLDKLTNGEKQQQK